MLTNNALLFPLSLYRAMLAEHLTLPRDVEPEVSKRGLGRSQDAVRGRDADTAGVLLQVPNCASPEGGCFAACFARPWRDFPLESPEQGDCRSQTFFMKPLLKFKGGWNGGGG